MSDATAPVVPTVPLTMLGSADAVACEGDSCLVVPPRGEDQDDQPGRRGVSR